MPLGALGPVQAASPSTQPPWPWMRWRCGRVGRKVASSPSAAGVSARRGVRSSTIQMPRPCVARTRSWSRGWMAMSRTATAEITSLELGEGLAAVVADPEAKLGAHVQEAAHSRVLAHHVRVSPQSLGVVGGHERRPACSEVISPKDPGPHLAEGVPVEGDPGGAGVVGAAVDVRHQEFAERAAWASFFQLFPESRVTCTLPSSVPTQMAFLSFLASEMA